MGATAGTPVRLLAAAAASVLVAAGVFLAHGVAPGRSELSDPLGLPVRLVESVVASTAAFDRDTATLVGQNGELAQRTSGLAGLAGALSELEVVTGRLRARVNELDGGTAATAAAAAGAPVGIRALDGRARENAAAVADLGTDVAGVGGALDRLVAALAALDGRLTELGPRADALEATLEAMRRDTAGLGALSGIIGGGA